MKLSQMHFRTLREVPTEAEIPSHILLLRAGMIKKVAAGIYSYMPMGWRTIRKIEQIIREEMDGKGAEEIYTQNVQPAELWKESGRWDAYGPEMWRLKDRNDREFCPGPTAEEVFTDIVKSDVSSHRQLPRMLYQITDKYRDEARPRYGMMRSRVFIMKDNYSFDKDAAGLDESYDKMYEAYSNVFSRCGLNFRPLQFARVYGALRIRRVRDRLLRLLRSGGNGRKGGLRGRCAAGGYRDAVAGKGAYTGHKDDRRGRGVPQAGQETDDQSAALRDL